MNFSGHSKFVFLLLIISFPVKSQDTLRLSRKQCEAIFLKENLVLIAEKLKIPQAEARIQQARLWPNPTVDLDEINLWATKKQLGVFGDDLQGFGGGNFGKNQQISFSVEQLILTAGKRKKEVDLEQVAADQTGQQFEDILRNLKADLRNKLTQLQHLQLSKELYQSQTQSIRNLSLAYKRQAERGNVPKGEHIRLRALELEMDKAVSELNKEIFELQKDLKLWMRLPAETILEITSEGFQKNIETLANYTSRGLIEQAKIYRPDYKIAQLERTYYGKLYAFEKAKRVPDLTLKGGYDRGGNFMYNFIGFGLSMDLPVFNKNQGNIQVARIGIEQADLLAQQTDLTIESEIVLAYQNLNNAIDFRNRIEPEYEGSLDELLNTYTKNLTSKNISLLEYLDFVDAYLENKKIILEAAKEVNNKAEELNYLVARDIL
jgi:cobalt-zinc-cadmium efflux system outer membrane protein